MVLREALIANTSLVLEELSKRINLYEYFTMDNNTHIICDNQAMPKNSHDYYDPVYGWVPKIGDVCTIVQYSI
jgi:hypothetical protein